jgi:hypothetical protein
MSHKIPNKSGWFCWKVELYHHSPMYMDSSIFHFFFQKEQINIHRVQCDAHPNYIWILLEASPAWGVVSHFSLHNTSTANSIDYCLPAPTVLQWNPQFTFIDLQLSTLRSRTCKSDRIQCHSPVPCNIHKTAFRIVNINALKYTLWFQILSEVTTKSPIFWNHRKLTSTYEGPVASIFRVEEYVEHETGNLQFMSLKTKLNTMASAREWTIPIGRLPLVGEVNANFFG